jgi:hypothetical protein
MYCPRCEGNDAREYPSGRIECMECERSYSWAGYEALCEWRRGLDEPRQAEGGEK